MASGISAPDEVELLGGLFDGRILVRTAKLRELTGEVEHRIGRTAESTAHTPQLVTAVIAAAVDSIGSWPMNPALARRLCTGDRQLLFHRVSEQAYGRHLWVRPLCQGCGARFDVRVDRSQIPTKPAGPGFPDAFAVADGRRVRLRAPTGADQEAIAGMTARDARRALLRACTLACNGDDELPSGFVDGLSDAAVEDIETALDEVAPDVGNVMDVDCPECGQAQQVALNPYGHGVGSAMELYEQVHAVASRYHWSEDQILALPRWRRLTYLHLIEQSQGFVTPGDPQWASSIA